MGSIARERLASERKTWRKNKPFGFYARPEKLPDGSQDLFRWKCGIPGKPKTLWEGGCYTCTMNFPTDYPNKPPKCVFSPVLFHPNIYPSGTVCLSILNAEQDWRPSITVRQVLLGIQDLLDNPNNLDPAQEEPFKLYRDDRPTYNMRIKEQVGQYPPPC